MAVCALLPCRCFPRISMQTCSCSCRNMCQLPKIRGSGGWAWHCSVDVKSGEEAYCPQADFSPQHPLFLSFLVSNHVFEVLPATPATPAMLRHGASNRVCLVTVRPAHCHDSHPRFWFGGATSFPGIVPGIVVLGSTRASAELQLLFHLLLFHLLFSPLLISVFRSLLFLLSVGRPSSRNC